MSGRRTIHVGSLVESIALFAHGSKLLVNGIEGVSTWDLETGAVELSVPFEARFRAHRRFSASPYP